MPDHVRAIFGSFQVSFIVSTTATLLELAKFCSMDTLELCGDILQPVGQLENPVLLMLIHHMVADSISQWVKGGHRANSQNSQKISSMCL